MTPGEEFASLGLYQDGGRIVSRDDVIREASIGVLEALVKMLREYDPPRVRSTHEFADWIEGLIGDYKELSPDE